MVVQEKNSVGELQNGQVMGKNSVQDSVLREHDLSGRRKENEHDAHTVS